MSRFQSTCPLRGTTKLTQARIERILISIHVPLAGHDAKTLDALITEVEDFNPRAPCGARLEGGWTRINEEGGISIHVPLAGHDAEAVYKFVPYLGISIHVPLAGHDHDTALDAPAGAISIHVPLAGHDRTRHWYRSTTWGFQSTCPLRGTTRSITQARAGGMDFNPRAPCGARPQKGTKITVHFCENRLDLRFSADSAACQEQNRS